MPSPKKTSNHEFSRWLNFHPNSKATLLPLDRDFARPLRELGIALAGEDQLEETFRAGTSASVTHLAWFVTKGQIHCEYQGVTYRAKAGECLLCSAGHAHYLELRSKRAAGLWFHLRAQARWEHLLTQPQTVRTCAQIPTLQLLVSQLLAESNSPAPLAESMALHYAELIAMILLRELSHSSDNHQVAQIERLRLLWKLVEQDPAEKWHTDKLAAEAGVSSSYFYKITERHYGTSPMQMVSRLRMRKAMALLTHTDLTIENIAVQVGYQTAYAFSNAFVRHQGTRPGAYRQQLLSRIE